MQPSIIQRKQIGNVSVLLVQIGLALYVIVVFLSQAADGSISPKILKVQKVAEANATRLEGSQTSQGQFLTALPQAATAQATALDAQIVALLAAPQAKVDPAPIVAEIATPAQSLFSYESTDIQTLGSKPRAPSVIA